MSEAIDPSSSATATIEQTTPSEEAENLKEVGAAGALTSETAADGDETVPAEEQGPIRDPRYPLTVAYCTACTLPAELHEYHSNTQFEKYVCLEGFDKNLL